MWERPWRTLRSFSFVGKEKYSVSFSNFRDKAKDIYSAKKRQENLSKKPKLSYFYEVGKR